MPRAACPRATRRSSIPGTGTSRTTTRTRRPRNSSCTTACGLPRSSPSRSTSASSSASTAGPGSPGETKPEWYFVHGEADKDVAVAASRRAIKELGEKGYRYVYREIDGADHGGITKYPDVADDAFLFLHALRHKAVPLSK